MLISLAPTCLAFVFLPDLLARLLRGAAGLCAFLLRQDLDGALEFFLATEEQSNLAPDAYTIGAIISAMAKYMIGNSMIDGGQVPNKLAAGRGRGWTSRYDVSIVRDHLRRLFNIWLDPTAGFMSVTAPEHAIRDHSTEEVWLKVRCPLLESRCLQR